MLWVVRPTRRSLGDPSQPPTHGGFSPLLRPHSVGPGCGILGAVVATDCDDSDPRPGTRTTLGRELIRRWVHHLRQGTARSPRALLPGRGASGFWAMTWLLPPGPSGQKALVLLVPSPPPKDSPAVVPYRGFYFGHSILLPENSTPSPSPPQSSRQRRCSLAVPFFQERSVGWWVGTERPPQTWPCVPGGEQQACERLQEERRWQRPPCGLSGILK